MTSDRLRKNKQVIIDFFAGQVDPSLDGFQHVADDATFWIAGDKSGNPSRIAGRWAGKERLAALAAITGPIIGKFEAMDIKHMTAEDDRVAVEAEGFIATQDGKVYNNLYHFLFTITDGKISEVKEYLDTVLVNEVFGTLADHADA